MRLHWLMGQLSKGLELMWSKQPKQEEEDGEQLKENVWKEEVESPRTKKVMKRSWQKGQSDINVTKPCVSLFLPPMNSG